MTEVTFGKLTLAIEDNRSSCKIIDCEKDVERIEIPSKVEGVNVVAIGERAFEDCVKLKEVTFSDEYFSPDFEYLFFDFEIGSHAFDGCVSLVNIEIPSRVNTICYGAFSGCTALVSIELPNCFVESYAFHECTSLKEITPLNYISEGVFSHCKSLQVLPIANGVKTISEDAFYHCYGLKNIVVPASVTRIEALAFRSCYNLESVTFENAEGWYVKNRYTQKEYHLDLSDPQKNAKMLSKMDFDDGVASWYKK